jgi:N-acylneuraminate cytidylyltransferase
MVKRIAIIPARGGSKRIPQKNIVNFCGKPMIAWTIEAALSTGLFDYVLVSTDCNDIAKVAEQFGANVPFLRNKAYDDITPVSQATIAALHQLKDFNNIEYDVVVQLMANCPIRDSKIIEESIRYFDTNEHKFQISTFKYGWMNPWWAIKVDAEKKPTFLFSEGFNTRSQDLPELQCPTGAVWIAKVPNLIESGTFYDQDFRTCLMPWQYALDIDDYEDLHMAEAVYATMQVVKK